MSDYVEPDFETDFDEVPPPVTYYTQMNGERTNFPFSCDCSGLVWWSFNELGLANAMFPSSSAGVSEMIEWFEACNWRQADLLLRWNENSPNGDYQKVLAEQTLNHRVFVDGVEDPEQSFLKPGDLLYRCDSPSGEGDHVGWFMGWVDASSTQMSIYDAHPLSNPPVSTRAVSYDYVVDTFTHAVRPKPIGSLMWHRYAASVPKAV